MGAVVETGAVQDDTFRLVELLRKLSTLLARVSRKAIRNKIDRLSRSPRHRLTLSLSHSMYERVRPELPGFLL